MTTQADSRREVVSSLEKQLRKEIQERQLDAKELAKRMNIVPLGGEFLLARTPWSLDTAFKVANALELNIEVKVGNAQ